MNKDVEGEVEETARERNEEEEVQDFKDKIVQILISERNLHDITSKKCHYSESNIHSLKHIMKITV